MGVILPIGADKRAGTLDRQAGIKRSCRPDKITENTLIIFHLTTGRVAKGALMRRFDSSGIFRGVKRDLFEGGVRVPMIARWPGKIKPGTEMDHLSAFWDVMPTLCELAGFETPPNIDDISFLLVLLGKGEQTYRPTRLLWALGHYSRFVRPGMVRVEVESDQSLEQELQAVMASAYYDQPGN